MNERNCGSASPIDGARRPADALDAAPGVPRPRTRHVPPARAIAIAVERPITPSPMTRTSAVLLAREDEVRGIEDEGRGH